MPYSFLKPFGVFSSQRHSLPAFKGFAILTGSNYDEFVKSRNFLEYVIPAKAGIQLFQGVLDPGFRRGDDPKDFLRDHHNCVMMIQEEINERRGRSQTYFNGSDAAAHGSRGSGLLTLENRGPGGHPKNRPTLSIRFNRYSRRKSSPGSIHAEKDRPLGSRAHADRVGPDEL